MTVNHVWDREDPLTFSGRPGPLLSCDLARRKAYKELGFDQVQCMNIAELPFVDKEMAKNTYTYRNQARRESPLP